MNEMTAESPIKVFGAMLAHYRVKAGMSPEQLAARVYLSASLIRKVEAGTRTPTEELAKSCDDALNCDGALMELFDRLSPAFRERSYPVWFGRWPDIEAAARTLRTFEPLVIPGVGSREVMREQLAHLQEMARRPSIVVQVIPLSTGAHQGLSGGAFVIADLPGKPLIAYQDTASSGQIIEDADDIEARRL
ncbi:MAG TPA: Scr1 family TA system antitoxin-like transcriptional regulator [Streptosporangiaceae bacterium]|nr:Scr1 family TA system antitoxin-like transcriptional regulator [Streptosporangiaceae bacterium]